MEIIVFAGIQASGKTSFYRSRFFKTHIRVSLDMLKTRNRERILVEACLRAKQALVIDNTNSGVEDRLRYIDAARQKGFRVIGYYFQSKISDCLLRNQTRTGKEAIPELGVKATYNQLVIPSYQEGFDELFYVEMKDKEFLVKEWNYS